VELQLRIDLSIDGYLLAYRGKAPASAVREYAAKRQQALESLQPITYWEDDAGDTEFAQYEVNKFGLLSTCSMIDGSD
jgi:hypothetical protein